MIEKIQIIPNDFRESFENMPIESVGRLTLALFRYANDEGVDEVLGDDQIAKAVFPTLKAHIERHEEYRRIKAESGRKGGKLGGATIGNQNARKTKQNKAKQSKTEQNKPPNPNPNPYPNPINNKRLYGECQNVKLTEDEYNKLVEKNYTGLIDELSLYIASKGDKYKSHYATILQWAKKRENETPGTIPFKPKEKPYQQMMKSTYDMDALEKKLIKN